jgi:hypothetical protein
MRVKIVQCKKCRVWIYNGDKTECLNRHLCERCLYPGKQEGRQVLVLRRALAKAEDDS